MKFLNDLYTRKVGDRLWELQEDFPFESDLYEGIFIAPKGYVTNFASIPRFAWLIFPPVGNYDAAAVIHDAACDKCLVTGNGNHINTVKVVCDNLFNEALKCSPGVSEISRFMLYRAVKKFSKERPILRAYSLPVRDKNK